MSPRPFISRCALLVTLLVIQLSQSARAQATDDIRARLTAPDSAHLQRITLTDGSTIVGRVVAVTGDTVAFQTISVGTIQLQIASIKAITLIPLSSDGDSRYWFPNPNTTRLFFAPTGQMLKQGEGYFSDYEVFFPGVSVGVTDNFTLGGGISLIPAAVEDQVYYVTPKIGFSPAEKLHLAAGALVISSQGETGGIYYGVGTVGDGNASFTVGAGYGFAGGRVERKPVAMAGAEMRLAERVAFVTENYLLPISDNNFLYSFGLRFMGEKMTTDLALFNVSGSNTIGLPFVDFVFRF